MKIRKGPYLLGLLVLLLFASCASNNHFEWVKINPDKINLAKNRAPQNNTVKQIHLTLGLKEKEREVYYTEPNGFFAEQNAASEDTYKSPLQKNISRSFNKAKPSVYKTNTTAKKPNELAAKASSTKSSSQADKLNSALKFPLNSKALKSTKTTASFGQTSSEIREMAFKDIKEKNPEIENKSKEKEKRGKNLMWAGLVLVVLGGIMGFVFGRSAFLIALVGVVFAAIGYFFRI